MKLKVVIHAGYPPNHRCRAVVPVLPGCTSEGDTPEEALANIREAIAAYFDASDPPHAATDRVEEIEVNVRQQDFPAASASESNPPRLRRFLMERGRHESAGFLALTAGLLGGLICGALALAPIWTGFLIGYLTTAGFAALVCTVDP